MGDIALEIKHYPTQEDIDRLVAGLNSDIVEANAHIIAPWLRKFRKLQNLGLAPPIDKYKADMPNLTTPIPLPADGKHSAYSVCALR